MGRLERIAEVWRSFYSEIVSHFGYSEEGDAYAASLIAKLMTSRGCLVGKLAKRVEGNTVIVAGASGTLAEEARELKRVYKGGYVVFAADGAVALLLEAGVVADAVFTDLDGRFPALVEAARGGSIIVIHAHGDNIDALDGAFRALEGLSVEATCQSEPVGHVHNFGGFTDGDRAAFAAVALGAAKVVLVGMCLDGEVSTLAKPEGWATAERLMIKRQKLSFAKRLLSWLADEFGNEVEFVDTTNCEHVIKGFEKRSLGEVL